MKVLIKIENATLMLTLETSFSPPEDGALSAPDSQQTYLDKVRCYLVYNISTHSNLFAVVVVRKLDLIFNVFPLFIFL